MMHPDNGTSSSASTARAQTTHSGRCSLPPDIIHGSQQVLPSYPSSMLHYYSPSPHNVANFAHTSTFPQQVSPHPPTGGNHGLLPSVSESRIPLLRHTPSTSPLANIDTRYNPASSLHDQDFRNNSRTSRRIYSVSPVVAYAHHPSSPIVVAPQPIPLPVHLPPDSPVPNIQPQRFFPPRNIHSPVIHNTSPLLPHFNTSLPSTKDVPLLSGKHDWGPWNSAVRALIMNANLLGHIADEPLPGASFDPGLWPTYPPTVRQDSSLAEIQLFTEWWTRDGLASHILTSRLTSSVLGCLPVANERMGHRRSSRTIYTTLCHQFGAGDYSAVMVIEARLRQLRCLPTCGGVRVTDFITTWRTSVNQMEAAGFLPGSRQLLSMFADGLPQNTVAFINLYDNIIMWLNVPNEQLLPNIHFLFDRTTNIENNIQRNRIMNPGTRRPISNSATNISLTHTTPSPSITSPPAPAVVTSSSNTRGTRSVLRCSNCGRDGHGGDTCFQPGGAMEGRRDGYLANRSTRPIAHIAEIEESQPDGEEGTAITEDITLNTEFASLSIKSAIDIFFSSYAMSAISEVSPTRLLALSLVSREYNSALDSACTNHIFCDRNVFHSYDVGGAIPVRTANCGSLTTLAIGDVKIKLVIRDKTVIWTLKNCLHAPDVPINLISVGALQEHHLSVTFSFQKTTISFPHTHHGLSGLSFDAYVTRRLSLLNLEFIPPPVLPLALPLFTAPQLSPDMWHRRFGHLGHAAFKNAINGSYATGITKPITPYPTSPRCIPCLIGKSPQAPYMNNAKRAASICDLVHIDTCGPFPTLTPRKEAYFTIFLDDKSNYGVTALLTNKNGVSQAWKRVEASWELLSGNQIKAVRLDGAKEFTQGHLSAHLLSRGIAMQVTAPYAHAQARKAERYVRTIEDGIQALLADTKLPPSFWGDAALTTQYLCNRSPTSTLPLNATPYEIMHGNKPDLAHLRVWGCQCFPSLPSELRTKGGPRRYEAIFVGYEDNRIGWRVRDMAGRYHFSRDVVFNESTPGHLSPHRGLSTNHDLLPPSSVIDDSSSIHDRERPLPNPHTTPNPLPIPNIADTIHARNLFTRTTRSTTISLPKPNKHYNDLDTVNLSISLNTIHTITPPSSPDPYTLHSSIFYNCFLSAPPTFLRARSWDLSKPPNSYHEATMRPDSTTWLAAMQQELDSLAERKAFERTTLPSGRKAVGVRWTYDYKYNPDGSIIRGKEKARLVAQGFSQRPEDFGETYAPVVKLSSVRILLAYADHYDLEIMSFDVKTAFLHARLPYDIFVKQIPSFPESDISTVL